ncbi:MAG TPA: regulatory protein RecX [Bacteroidales bacterium]|nr:regulatory protein RecX [Bacteroidales bacterium]
MDDLKHEDELLQRAQQLCSSREYCVSDITAKIDQWGENDPEVTERIIGKLVSEKFIDEERYCRAFARDHFKYQHWGKVKINASLRIKKIPAVTVAEGLEAIDNEEYMATLRELLETHRRSVKAKNRYDLKGKLVRYALSKGFESHLVYEMVNSLVNGLTSE